MNAATVSEPLHFDGVGLHTGQTAAMVVNPAPAGTGIVFDLDGVRIPAIAEYAQESPLATVLAKDGASVSTIEHVLSALVACGVSDAAIVLRGPEVPILDGSARPYVEAIAKFGLEDLGAARPMHEVREPFELRDGNKAVVVLPSNEFRVRVLVDFPFPVGTQYFDAVITPEIYGAEIAGSRTWGFLRDVEAMRANGLARGGTMENALVYNDDGPMQPLQWPNEVVRHKVLDLIGDFALLGAWPQCEVIAIKSGHALHTRVTRELRKRG